VRHTVCYHWLLEKGILFNNECFVVTGDVHLFVNLHIKCYGIYRICYFFIVLSVFSLSVFSLFIHFKCYKFWTEQSLPYSSHFYYYLQEAFKAVEDIHGLINLSKKPPKPSLMANFYQKLGLVFWKSGNHMFHACAYHRLLHLSREQKKNLSQEELHKSVFDDGICFS